MLILLFENLVNIFYSCKKKILNYFDFYQILATIVFTNSKFFLYKMNLDSFMFKALLKFCLLKLMMITNRY